MKINEYLEENNMQLDELAHLLGYSYSHLSKVNVGITKWTKKFRRRCIDRIGILLCPSKEKR